MRLAIALCLALLAPHASAAELRPARNLDELRARIAAVLDR